MTYEPPEDLRRKIAADLRPVRPLASPWRRVWLVVPILAVAWAAGPAWLGLRDDLPRIGPLLSWGASLLQFAVAVAVVAFAFREAAPGEAAPRAAALALLSCAAAFSLVLGWRTAVVSPEPIPRAETFAAWEFCWSGMMVAGLPLLVLLALLLARGLLLRPALAGMLAGLAAGLTVDGGWRLYCNYSNPTHVYGSHGGAVLALAAIGLAAGPVLDRWHRRRR